jgi:hypothetical protein
MLRFVAFVPVVSLQGVLVRATHAPPKPAVLIPLLCAIAGISAVIFYGRSALFVPHAWFNMARPLVWLATSVLLLAAIAVRMHVMKDPKNTFSTHSLLFVAASALLGYIDPAQPQWKPSAGDHRRCPASG